MNYYFEPFRHEKHDPVPDCDCGECAKHERDRLRAALLDVARRVEALKRPCGMDPETPQAIRNGEYMSIALIARAAMMGPNAIAHRPVEAEGRNGSGGATG